MWRRERAGPPAITNNKDNSTYLSLSFSLLATNCRKEKKRKEEKSIIKERRAIHSAPATTNSPSWRAIGWLNGLACRTAERFGEPLVLLLLPPPQTKKVNFHLCCCRRRRTALPAFPSIPFVHSFFKFIHKFHWLLVLIGWLGLSSLLRSIGLAQPHNPQQFNQSPINLINQLFPQQATFINQFHESKDK